MPKVDFDKIDEMDDFSPVPEDSYVCELIDVKEDTTTTGGEMWKLKFKIVEGEYQGRYLFDNMVFSQEAAKRVKFICSRMGLKTQGNVNLTPDMLLHRRTIVNPVIEEYEDEHGKEKRRNKIPFAGYELYEAVTAGTGAVPGANGSPFSKEKLPF